MKCLCGCEKRVRDGRRFLKGHNARVMSGETKNKMRKAKLGIKFSKSHIAGISNSLSGRKLSKKHRANISESNKIYKNLEKHKRRGGYVTVFLDNHPSGRRHIREHWLVIEKYLGRIPKFPECVHHLNEIKSDNRIRNLMLFKNSWAHLRFHDRGDAGVNSHEIIFDGRIKG